MPSMELWVNGALTGSIIVTCRVYSRTYKLLFLTFYMQVCSVAMFKCIEKQNKYKHKIN